jgi:transcriptional regulator with XRE-family HTH domain
MNKGIKQEELAEKAGVSQATVSYLERGILKGGIFALNSISVALEYSGDPFKLIEHIPGELWQNSA